MQDPEGTVVAFQNKLQTFTTWSIDITQESNYFYVNYCKLEPFHFKITLKKIEGKLV